MTTAAVRVAGPRVSRSLRVARIVARVHVVLAICLGGYSALWVTTLQSSEGHLDRLGITRLDIKLTWFSLAAVIVLAVLGSRLVRGGDVVRRRRAAIGVHLLAALNAVWQAALIYQPWIVEFVAAPLVITVLLVIAGRDEPQ